MVKEQLNYSTLIQYMSAIALALFFLIYMPWTYLSFATEGMDPVLLWVYYFTLVLGLMFPLYYAIGKENLSWYCLGLSILIASVVWAAVDTASPNHTMAAVMTLILGLLFFIAPLIEPRMSNWNLWKNVFHMAKGLFMILAAGFYAGWSSLDAFVGETSWNHVMPQFIYMGGGIAVVFGFALLAYGLFNILSSFTGEKIGALMGDLAKIFYMLMVLIFLLGITYNATSYIATLFAILPNNPWSVILPFDSASIGFFGDMFGLGSSNLGAILLIVVYLYGMSKIAQKFE